MTLEEMILEQQTRFQILQTAIGIMTCMILLLFLAMLLLMAKLKRYEKIYGPLESDETEII